MPASFMDLHRLPELFCGFPRRVEEGPTLYPVACLPQAWAAGSVYMLLEACMGLSIDATASQVRFQYPHLPSYIEAIDIERLPVGPYRVDLCLRRSDHDVGVHVTQRDGPVEVVVVK